MVHDGLPTNVLRRFESWFEDFGGLTHVDGSLFRSPIPWKSAHFSALRDAGIRVVYSLTEDVLAQEEHVRKLGFDWRPHFWTDDEPPKAEEMDRFLEDYLSLAPETPKLVHCNAGWGRTGSAVACALMATRGWGADEAMRHYWSCVPAARRIMDRNGQSDFVREYESRLRQARLS